MNPTPDLDAIVEPPRFKLTGEQIDALDLPGDFTIDFDEFEWFVALPAYAALQSRLAALEGALREVWLQWPMTLPETLLLQVERALGHHPLAEPAPDYLRNPSHDYRVAQDHGSGETP